MTIKPIYVARTCTTCKGYFASKNEDLKLVSEPGEAYVD